MNQKIQPDLLSAYFDGEATESERADIEIALAQSPELQRELDEISQLSGLLHSFPRLVAPSSIRDDVGRRTDQITLVGTAPSDSKRSLRREFAAAFVGSIVTAASLFLIVDFTDSTRSSRQETATIASSAPRINRSKLESAKPASLESVGQGSDMKQLELTRDLGTRTDTDGDGILVADTDSTVNENSVEKSSVAPSADAITGIPASNDFEANSASLYGGGQLVSSNIVGNGLVIDGLENGEIRQIVVQQSDPEKSVAVFDVEVIDLERGLDQIQILLKKNSIEPRASDSTASSDQKDEADNQIQRNEIAVIYVEARGNQLARTLEEMNQHPDLYQWYSVPPLDLANANSGSRSVATTSESTDAIEEAKKSDLSRSRPDAGPLDKQSTVGAKSGVVAEGQEAVEQLVEQRAHLAMDSYRLRNQQGYLQHMSSLGIRQTQPEAKKAVNVWYYNQSAPVARITGKKQNAKSQQKNSGAERPNNQNVAIQKTIRLPADSSLMTLPTQLNSVQQPNAREQQSNSKDRFATSRVPKSERNSKEVEESNNPSPAEEELSTDSPQDVPVKAMFVVHPTQKQDSNE